MLGSSIGDPTSKYEQKKGGAQVMVQFRHGRQVKKSTARQFHHRSVYPISGIHRVYDLFLYRDMAYNREEDQEGASCNSAAEARMEK